MRYPSSVENPVAGGNALKGLGPLWPRFFVPLVIQRIQGVALLLK